MINERQKLGDLLKQEGLVSEEQIEAALHRKKDNQKLGNALVEQGYITERQLLEVLAVQLNLQNISLYKQHIDSSLAELIAKDFARRNLLVPVKLENNRLTVAMNDPLDFYAIGEIELSTGYNLRPVIATRDDILQAINRLYDTGEFLFNLTGDDDAPAVRILDQLLETGVAINASDIHLDPSESDIMIRYRVDGQLRNDKAVPKAMMSSLIVRIKIMAGLDITESRLPQDGRISTTISSSRINLRISTLPTVYGEKIVIRILDMSNIVKNVDNIGLQEDILAVYKNLIHEPSGLILITGPTGSGKTSTLYGSINELNRPEVNIVTVEDPVEYQLEGINQVQVNSAIGLTFANGLRSIVRQDPDIIMVGEIRDTETAEISIRSALTGHLVLSTLHTNSAIDAIPRLYDMGVEPYLVLASVKGIMAQRLVKTICSDCLYTREASPLEREVFQKRQMEIEYVSAGEGCDACMHTGYRGRMAIHELIVITDAFKKLLQEKKSVEELKQYVRSSGVRFLIDDGLVKVKQGKTTLEEILRVASLND